MAFRDEDNILDQTHEKQIYVVGIFNILFFNSKDVFLASLRVFLNHLIIFHSFNISYFLLYKGAVLCLIYTVTVVGTLATV